MKQDMIVILDLGSEENPRLAREIRALGVYSEIYPHDITLAELNALPNVKGIILNGGPNHVVDGVEIDACSDIYGCGLPLLQPGHKGGAPWPTDAAQRKAVLSEFVFDACGAQPNWNMENFIADQVELIRRQVGDKKVLLALSGGVDSSVCIQILRDQGFDVQAVVIRFSPAHDAAVRAAQTVARQLGVPLIEEDCTEEFEQQVVEPFCAQYCAGRTPSPCVLCNPRVKFAALARVADRLGIRYIATGHYARVTEENGLYYVRAAVSPERDQSYVLCGRPKNFRPRLCLPVGEFEKSDIREMAASAQLASADAPDSQEICFIPDGDYAAYIAARGLFPLQGRFIGPDGEDLGPHKGVWHYTVGQRKGLNIAYGTPLFVRRIRPNGDVELARGGDEFFSGIVLTDAARADGRPILPGERYGVKVRSRAAAASCTVEAAENDSVTLRFDEPQRAPAPGQAAVLYDGELVRGGGTICEML